MEITSTVFVECCPRCRRQPQVTQKKQSQVCCDCGASGPGAHSAQEAASRWRSVVHYMRQHQAHVGEMLQELGSEDTRGGPIAGRFVRNW